MEMCNTVLSLQMMIVMGVIGLIILIIIIGMYQFEFKISVENSFGVMGKISQKICIKIESGDLINLLPTFFWLLMDSCHL